MREAKRWRFRSRGFVCQIKKETNWSHSWAFRWPRRTKAFSVNRKGRAFARGKAIDESSFSSLQLTSALVYSACANNEVSISVRKEYDHVSSPFGLKKKTTCPRSLTSDVWFSVYCFHPFKLKNVSDPRRGPGWVSEENLLSRKVSEAHSEALTVLPSSISAALAIRWRWPFCSLLVHFRISWLERKKLEAPTSLNQAQDCCGCAAGLPDFPLFHLTLILRRN